MTSERMHQRPAKKKLWRDWELAELMRAAEDSEVYARLDAETRRRLMDRLVREVKAGTVRLVRDT